MSNHQSKNLLVLLASTLLFLGACEHLFEVQWINAIFDNGVVFIGVRQKETAPITFFSVRIEGENDAPISAACPIFLKYRGKAIRVADLTTSTASSMGFNLLVPDYLPPGRIHGFVGGATSQNRDFGIELKFVDGQINEFYARHNPRSPIQCPFRIGKGVTGSIIFPTSEEELTKAFGEPKKINAVWGH